MSGFDFDVAVVGGGVVGLAVMCEFSRAGRSVVLFERHDGLGRETSSRNSEVVHGGMYYPPGSLKARLCVRGRRALAAFAARHGVPFRKVGKIIVAVSGDEAGELEKIRHTGLENGVEGLRFLSGAETAAFAPGVRAEAALYSPETAVVSAHGLMDALLRLGESAGAVVVRGAAVRGLEKGWVVCYSDSGGGGSVRARVVVNCGGLGAQAVMRMAGIDPDAADLRLHPCKGRYFAVGGESRGRIAGLIYPAPERNLAGLGIHTLVDFGGGVKLGPDVEYVSEAPEYDYSVDAALGDMFYERALRYLPFLKREDIGPDMAGVRPKLSGPGEIARDFYIAHEAERGLEGFVNLAGIESPGLTSCLSIASMVRELAQ